MPVAAPPSVLSPPLGYVKYIASIGQALTIVGIGLTGGSQHGEIGLEDGKKGSCQRQRKGVAAWIRPHLPHPLHQMPLEYVLEVLEAGGDCHW